MGQEDSFSNLSNALREPLIAVDEHGSIVSSNDAASRLFARGDQALVGMPLRSILWSHDSEALSSLLRRGATTRAVAELFFGSPSGETAAVDVTVWPLDGAGAARTAVLVHDLRKRADSRGQMRYQAAELEAERVELGARADEAARNARELKTALETRHRFYASMSHELRTPVNAILGYGELLLDGIYGELTAPQSKILRRSLRAASHLQELLNDLLDLARIEEGRLDLQPEPVNVAELVEGLLDSVGPLAREHAVTLRHETHPDTPILVSDPRRIRKILLHLLTNAIKYGGRGPVTIRSGRTSVGDGAMSDGVFIEVVDRGAGIAPDELDRIFTEFVRHRSDKEGTGLGLSIARGLSQALGGTLVAESTPGRGSTFRLTLPRLGDGDEEYQHALPLARDERQ